MAEGLLVAMAFGVALLPTAQASLGGRLDRQYTGYVPQPTTSDQAALEGWLPVENATCDDQLGTPWLWNNPTGVPSGVFNRDHPVLLYFSAAGQISAISVAVVLEGPAAEWPWFTRMTSLGYLVRSPFLRGGESPIHTITVATRASSALCDPETRFIETLGTRLVINPTRSESPFPPLPLNHTAAVGEGYHRGSCFNGMGWHHFKDLRAPHGEMSWDALNLMPVVPMYSPVDGKINAIFFASAVVQQKLLPPNAREWEPIPLPNPLMCGNFCDEKCTFTGVGLEGWSTMHFYFNNHSEKSLTCTESPEIKSCPLGVICCPNSTN